MLKPSPFVEAEYALRSKELDVRISVKTSDDENVSLLIDRISKLMETSIMAVESSQVEKNVVTPTKEEISHNP